MLKDAYKSMDIAGIRDRLRQQNAACKGHNEGSEGRCSTPVRLLLFLVILALTTMFIASLLRANMHHLQPPVAEDSHQRVAEQLRIRLTGSKKLSSLLRPWVQDDSLDQTLKTLKQIAESPAEWRAYLELPESGRQVMIAHKQRPPSNRSAESPMSQQKCASLEKLYLPLIDANLSPFQSGLSQRSLRNQSAGEPSFLYIKNGIVFLDDITPALKALAERWASYFSVLSMKVKLPDIMLPLNSDDASLTGTNCWLSSCRRPHLQNSILLPNVLEDELFSNLTSTIRTFNSQRNDIAVWLGQPWGWQRGYQEAVLEVSRTRPDKVYAGLTDWKDVAAKEGIDQDTLSHYNKRSIAISDWAKRYKYTISIPGRCGSSSLAYQLYSDAATFLVISEDEQWFTPMLRPYIHYIPVEVSKDGSTDLLQQIDWAEQHPSEVQAINLASRAFAEEHLIPGSGRDCYSLFLIHKLKNLMNKESFSLPASAQAFELRT